MLAAWSSGNFNCRQREIIIVVDHEQMIRHMVARIRKAYRPDAAIIIRMDSGFFDQKIFGLCEELEIGYVCGGKLYKDIVSVAESVDEKAWSRYDSGKKESWEYIEFASRRGSWKAFRRTIYCRLVHDCGGQMVLPGCRPDTVIITNIGQGQPIDRLLKEAGAEEYLEAHGIVSCYHERGSDELANRALKDFGHEQLPFKRFNPNAAWYYSMLLGHFLMESYKEDVGTLVVPLGAYASTVRRRLIDIAGKIVSHSGKVVLKVTTACFESLGLSDLFDRCYRAPIIV